MIDKKEYFDSVLNFIDNLSDEEFDKLLIESGIEECPYENINKKYERLVKVYFSNVHKKGEISNEE